MYKYHIKRLNYYKRFDFNENLYIAMYIKMLYN